mmetsp:Transcript_65555/g.211456  ORF Transcript_65555/g.211456 Transcript_65555/m.211456 type:complete len:238 (-) Transcript_65555:357-1070(-)
MESGVMLKKCRAPRLFFATERWRWRLGFTTEELRPGVPEPLVVRPSSVSGSSAWAWACSCWIRERLGARFSGSTSASGCRPAAAGARRLRTSRRWPKALASTSTTTVVSWRKAAPPPFCPPGGCWAPSALCCELSSKFEVILEDIPFCLDCLDAAARSSSVKGCASSTLCGASSYGTLRFRSKLSHRGSQKGFWTCLPSDSKDLSALHCSQPVHLQSIHCTGRIARKARKPETAKRP